jgi:hypothetical protein
MQYLIAPVLVCRQPAIAPAIMPTKSQPILGSLGRPTSRVLTAVLYSVGKTIIVVWRLTMIKWATESAASRS